MSDLFENTYDHVLYYVRLVHDLVLSVLLVKDLCTLASFDFFTICVTLLSIYCPQLVQLVAHL